MPNKALLRPYFLGKGVGIAGLPLALNVPQQNPSPKIGKPKAPLIASAASLPSCVTRRSSATMFQGDIQPHLYKILQEGCISRAILVLVWSFTEFVRLAKKSQHLESQSNLPH